MILPILQICNCMGRFQLAIGHQKSQRVWIPVQQCSSTTFYLSLLISPGYKTWKCSTCGYGMRWAQCWFPVWIEWRGDVKHCKTAIICMTAVHVHDFDILWWCLTLPCVFLISPKPPSHSFPSPQGSPAGIQGKTFVKSAISYNSRTEVCPGTVALD